MATSSFLNKCFVALVLGFIPFISGQCLEDSALNDFFIPTGELDEGSCCQNAVCGLGCPEEVSPPARGKILFSLWPNHICTAAVIGIDVANEITQSSSHTLSPLTSSITLQVLVL